MLINVPSTMAEKYVYKFDYRFKRYKRFTLGGSCIKISKNSTQGKVGTKINNLQPHQQCFDSKLIGVEYTDQLTLSQWR